MRIFRRVMQDQRGIAMPLALAVLFVVAGLAAVAARAGITASHQSYRDGNLKRAVQAANAGVDAAIYQLNLLQPTVNECVVRSSAGANLSTQAAPTSGWCPAQTEDLGGNASYTVQASKSSKLAFNSNGQVVTQRTVVSTGTVNGVLRRVSMRVTAPAGDPLFPKGFAVVSLNSVSYGNTVSITGNLGSNGNITLGNTAKVTGSAVPGIGKSVTLNQSATVSGAKTAATEPFALAPVNQRGAPTLNDNGRIGTTDPWTNPGDITWNPTTRVLSMRQSSTLTLTGNTYSFCRIELSNSASLRIAVRDTLSPLRIYMDTPENCGGGAGMGSVALSQSSSIQNLNSDSATFALLVSGSAAKATSVTLGQSGGPTEQVVMGIYAPFSTVTLANSVNFIGAIVAKQVQLNNSVKVTYDPKIETIAEDALLVYRNSDYVECTNLATTATTPDSGC